MRGSCLCGRVRYQISGTPRSVVGCHCTQCRKSSGHYVAATQIPNEHLKITGLSHVTWFQSSESAKRGFCRNCGSQLFWAENGSPNTSIMAGTLDGATGLTMDRQIHTDAKGDYYTLPLIDTVDQSSL